MSPRHAFLYDFGRWPLVVTCDYGDSDQQAIEAFYSELSRRVDKGDRYYTISLLDHATPGHAAHAEIGGVWMQANHARIDRQMIGATIVARSAVMRSAVERLLQDSQMPGGKHTFVPSLMDAVHDANAAFTREGLRLPPAPSGWPRVYL